MDSNAPINNQITPSDSKAEDVVYSYLIDNIDSDYYEIGKHCLISEVFNIKNDVLVDKYRHFCLLFFSDEYLQKCDFFNNDLSKTHFDFVIFSKENHMPVLIIEINGSTHLTQFGKIMMDSYKAAHSQSNFIPLITIPLYRPYTDAEIHEILQNAIFAINVRAAIPAYCPQCGEKLGLRKNKTSNAQFYFCPNCKVPNSTKSKTYSLYKIPLLLKKQS